MINNFSHSFQIVWGWRWPLSGHVIDLTIITVFFIPCGLISILLIQWGWWYHVLHSSIVLLEVQKETVRSWGQLRCHWCCCCVNVNRSCHYSISIFDSERRINCYCVGFSASPIFLLHPMSSVVFIVLPKVSAAWHEVLICSRRWFQYYLHRWSREAVDDVDST